MLAETSKTQNLSADLLGRSFARQLIEQGACSKDLIEAANSILAEALLLERKKSSTQNKSNLQVVSKQT